MSTSDNTNLPFDGDDEEQGKLEAQGIVEHEVKVERIIEKAAVKAAILVKREYFSGPLPKPDHLKAYDDICPGAAQDILNEFKANGLHVRKCEEKALDASINKVKRGQFIAAFLAISCLILAVICVAMFEANGVAIALVVLTGTVVLPFLGFNPKSSKKEDDKENE